MTCMHPSDCVAVCVSACDMCQAVMGTPLAAAFDVLRTLRSEGVPTAGAGAGAGAGST